MKKLREIVEESTVDGPYHSPWTDKAHYIIKTVKGITTVADGQQPHEGILHPDMKSAKEYFKENGFVKKEPK